MGWARAFLSLGPSPRPEGRGKLARQSVECLRNDFPALIPGLTSFEEFDMIVCGCSGQKALASRDAGGGGDGLAVRLTLCRGRGVMRKPYKTLIVNMIQC